MMPTAIRYAIKLTKMRLMLKLLKEVGDYKYFQQAIDTESSLTLQNFIKSPLLPIRICPFIILNKGKVKTLIETQ